MAALEGAATAHRFAAVDAPRAISAVSTVTSWAVRRRWFRRTARRCRLQCIALANGRLIITVVLLVYFVLRGRADCMGGHTRIGWLRRGKARSTQVYHRHEHAGHAHCIIVLYFEQRPRRSTRPNSRPKTEAATVHITTHIKDKQKHTARERNSHKTRSRAHQTGLSNTEHC